MNPWLLAQDVSSHTLPFQARCSELSCRSSLWPRVLSEFPLVMVLAEMHKSTTI